MTSEEIIKGLNDISCCDCKEWNNVYGTCNAERKCDEYLIEAVMVLKTAEKSDKYRWHNLRKNPEDLPTDNHQVLVAFDGMKICDIAIYVSSTKLWGTVSFAYKTGQVIAWREIEPFESEAE